MRYYHFVAYYGIFLIFSLLLLLFYGLLLYYGYYYHFMFIYTNQSEFHMFLRVSKQEKQTKQGGGHPKENKK